MKRKDQPKMVVIHWKDAMACNSEDQGVAPIDTLSFGLVARNEKDYVVVASEVFIDGSWRDGKCIPKAMIVGVEVVPFRVPKGLQRLRAR